MSEIVLRQGNRGARVEDLQRLLVDLGHGLRVDGVFGPRTAAAVHNFQSEAGLAVVDQATFDALRSASLLADDFERAVTVDLPLAPWDGPAERQPRSYDEALRMVGNPDPRGTGEVDPTWRAQNLTSRLDLAGCGDLVRGRYVTVHKLVMPYLAEALARAQAVAPGYKLSIVGGFAFRRQRHDAARALSAHAFGFAVDINPEDNKARTFRRGECPEAFSAAWRKLWPKGVPPSFVDAFRSCGFAWGGDWDEDGDTTDTNYCDPMHFEWIARDGVVTDV